MRLSLTLAAQPPNLRERLSERHSLSAHRRAKPEKLSLRNISLLFKAVNKSVICRNIAVLEAVLPVPERARGRILAIAKTEAARRQKRIGTVEEFVEAYPELMFLIDGVEQEKRKPKDKERRKND